MEQHHFLRHYESQPELQSNRNIHTIDLNGQISQPLSYFNPIAPDDGANLQWNSGFEPDRKRIKEHDFLENITQISCVDFMGLSRDNNTPMASTGDSASLSLLGDGNIDRQLLQQDAEIDRFLRLQSDRLRETILEKVRATQLQNISIIEDKVLQKLREKEAEVESINKRNIELEEQMQQLATEADIWQQRARYNESMVAALKFNLEQVYAQSRDCKEGCGDSEVDDAASCFNGHSIDFHLLTRGNRIFFKHVDIVHLLQSLTESSLYVETKTANETHNSQKNQSRDQFPHHYHLPCLGYYIHLHFLQIFSPFLFTSIHTQGSR